MAGKFKKATAQREFFKAGLYGATGRGKTLTAHLILEGLGKLEKKRVAYIDTEKGTVFYQRTIPERAVHPAGFDFDYLTTRSIYEALEAVESLDPEVYGALGIDSITTLWDAAKDAYQGKKTSKGSIPVQAWGEIKKPYKRLLSLFLDGPFHAVLCGREGVEMEDDGEGGAVVVGKKMKAEGETPYEPHVLVRMSQQRQEDGSAVIRAFIEKDRSGILSGKTLDWPNYQTFEPLVHILTGDSPTTKLGTPEDVAEKDGEMADRREASAEGERLELFQTIRGAINDANTIDQLKTAWSLTQGKKAKLGSYFEELEGVKDARKTQLGRMVA